MKCSIDTLSDGSPGRGVAAASDSTMEQIGLHNGDYALINVAGGGSTVVRIFSSDVQPDTVQLDNNVIEEVNADAGSGAKIEQVELPEADSIRVVPSGDVPEEVLEQFTAHFLDAPVIEGRTFEIGDGEIRVETIQPTHPAAIAEDTEVTTVAPELNTSDIVDEDAALSNIGGFDDEIDRLRSIIEVPTKNPGVFNELGGSPPTGVLVSGPGGAGKSTLVHAIVSESAAELVNLSGSALISSDPAEAMEQMEDAFSSAIDGEPSVLFIDEFDHVGGEDAPRSVVGKIATLMDAVADNPSVTVIAACRDQQEIPESLRTGDRFDRSVELDSPSANERADILRVQTRDVPLDPNIDIDAIAEQMEGYVPGDITEAIDEAVLNAAVRSGIDTSDADTLRGRTQITEEDITAAIETVNPTSDDAFATDTPDTNWTDIGGLDEPKQRLREAIEWPFDHADVLNELNLDASTGLLLHGPPGTGKTMLAKAAANESNATFIPIKGPEIMDKWVGESERKVRELFETARENAPAIVFFDEIDTIASERDEGSEGGKAVVERVLSQLLTEMDGIDEQEDVIVIGTTNRPGLIDDALLRPGRFDQKIKVPRPDEAARKEILSVHTDDRPLAANVDLNTIAAATEGYSAADIEGVCREAAMEAARDAVGDGTTPRIKQKHFEAAVQATEPTGEDFDSTTSDNQKRKAAAPGWQ